MPDSQLLQRIQKFITDMSHDVVEERVAEYVCREVANGRRLTEVLTDPYVKNRLSDEKLEHVLENPGVAAAMEEQIIAAFKNREFGFGD